MSSLRAAALERYQRWNNAIHATLFAEPRAQAPVYIYLEPELLAEAGRRVGVSAGVARTELIAAVRGSLGWDRVDTPFLWHLGEAYAWAEDGMVDAPPFLALLAVLVLGAEAMVSDGQHAAHNYYDRLLDLLEADSTLEARIRRDFKDTVELWQLLNDWLVQWDGELGLPSAQVTDRRVNIGYALSQALVSAQDRLRLAAAFEDYGLRPGRRMAPLEMEQYLTHWIASSSAPARLKRLWSNDEARRRIILAACGELEAWAGPQAQIVADRASGRVPLLWRADVTRGALPCIDLFLACQADPSRVEGRYRVIAPTDEAGREGLASAGEALSIQPLRGSSLCALEPWGSLSLAALIAGAFTLERTEGTPSRLARSSNPIIVLTYDERDALWHEVTRAQLLEPCVVLAHVDALPRVEPHLARFAREGFLRHEAASLDGLPPSWVAFLDVVLADAPEEEATGVMSALSPMRADVVAFEGGLRLGRQTWHADAPPDISATLAAERPLRIAIESRQGQAGEPVSLVVGNGIGRVSASLGDTSLGSGDFIVSLKSQVGDKLRLLDEATLRLRTADQPRPVRGDEDAAPVYVLSHARGLVSAAPAAEPDGTAVRGALLIGAVGESFADAAPSLPAVLATPLEAPRAEAPEPQVEPRNYAMPCALRGHHYWIVDRAEPDDNRYTLKHMQCRDCQREEWRRSVSHTRRAPARRMPYGRRAPAPPRARLPASASVTALRRPVLELMLDALSYIGSGSWAGLREMAQSLAPGEPYLAAEAARALVALGHIDLTLDPRSQRPAAWRITPATLVETSDGSWVLAGARSDRLVEAVLSTAHAPSAREGAEFGLAVIRIRPASIDALLALAVELEVKGMRLAISEDFPLRVASRLPALAGLLDMAEPYRLGADGVEQFDVPSRQWVAAGVSRGRGAYRVEHHGRLCGMTRDNEHGLIRITDHLSAKHLAAAAARSPLVAYDPEKQVLSVPLGAELPGLLDRVATLCSGAPAVVQRDSWTVNYPSVPSAVAGQLQRVLGITSKDPR